MIAPPAIAALGAPGDVIARRPETLEDEAFRFDLFRDSRQPREGLSGLDPTLADQLMRHQFAGQGASYRTRFPGARHDIVEVEGAPVGRTVVDEGDEVWTLVDVAILSAWRGRGLGTRLITDIMASARTAGRPVRLTVRGYNVGAARLYARLGFVVVGSTELDAEMLWRSRV